MRRKISRNQYTTRKQVRRTSSTPNQGGLLSNDYVNQVLKLPRITTPKTLKTKTVRQQKPRVHGRPILALKTTPKIVTKTVCRTRSERRAVILKTGHGGKNGAKLYKSPRSDIKC